ncbi:MAG TPA: serine/threonine-protein kinase, partial [Polyangia bacterium]|nr:serine/threonine-protein kinase [Polyangia bacterium]
MAELSDPKIGVLIEGRYRLAERLASGGMGVVYRAERVGIGKAVAIKFLHEQFAVLPDLVKRFEREAAVMSQLSHPNLVSVIDYGVHQGAPYLVMEFHTGALLGDLIAEGPISCQRAVSITRQILSGMRHAHLAGVVHRDLKPDNILLLGGVEGDFVKILDFGLAKIVRGDGEDSTQLTNAGFALGTPGYMSPEQASGGRIDHRTDIYSVGIMLFEMVVGRKPFRAESPLVLLRMQMDDPPPRPRQAAPMAGISLELEAAILRSLEKPPAKRYQDAGEFAVALEGTPEGQSSGLSMQLPALAARSQAATMPEGPPPLPPLLPPLPAPATPASAAASAPPAASAAPAVPEALPPSLPSAALQAPMFEEEPSTRDLGPAAEKPVVVVVRHGSLLGLLGKLLLVTGAVAGGLAAAWIKLHPHSAAQVRQKLDEARRVVTEPERQAGRGAPGKGLSASRSEPKTTPPPVAKSPDAASTTVPEKPVQVTPVMPATPPPSPPPAVSPLPPPPDATPPAPAPPAVAPPAVAPRPPDAAPEEEDEIVDDEPLSPPPQDTPGVKAEQEAQRQEAQRLQAQREAQRQEAQRREAQKRAGQK